MGCHSAPGELDGQQTDKQSQQAATAIQTGPAALKVRRQQLSWSDDHSGLQQRPQGHEQLATGPSAVAVTPQGAVLVLDRLAGRVVRVVAATDGDASVQTLMQVPVDVEDLSVGRDGALLAFSSLNWMGRGAIYGGVYGRPIVVANFGLGIISGGTMISAVLDGRLPAWGWGLALVFTLQGLGFFWLMRRPPWQADTPETS